jgi:N-acetylneuraminate synthase
MKKPYLIGEIGINHNGSLKMAKELILLAKDCKFDAVKFQKRDPDFCVPENQKEKLRNTPWGMIKYLDYKKKLEFGVKEYIAIDKYCKKLKIEWFASPWDINSLNFLKRFKLKYQKVASAMLKNSALVEKIAKERKKTFISTGGASMQEILKATKIFKKHKCSFIVMHSVSLYPADDKSLNINFIKELQKKFGKNNVGYSGHERTTLPSILAASLGAAAIERHITLDRTLWGTDQSASLAKAGMLSLAESCAKIQAIMGDGKKRYLKEENKKISTMIYWKNK